MLSWLFGKSEYGTIRFWNDNGTMCKALVADNGKILSSIDCWDDNGILYLCQNKGRIMNKKDGRYLVEPGVGYTI